MKLKDITDSELAMLGLNRFNVIKDFATKQNLAVYIQECINELKQILTEFETRVMA